MHSNENLGNFSGEKFQEIRQNAIELIKKCRSSRKLVLLVVFIALFFDNMLLTTIGKLKNVLIFWGYKGIQYPVDIHIERFLL